MQARCAAVRCAPVSFCTQTHKTIASVSQNHREFTRLRAGQAQPRTNLVDWKFFSSRLQQQFANISMPVSRSQVDRCFVEIRQRHCDDAQVSENGTRQTTKPAGLLTLSPNQAKQSGMLMHVYALATSTHFRSNAILPSVFLSADGFGAREPRRRTPGFTDEAAALWEPGWSVRRSSNHFPLAGSCQASHGHPQESQAIAPRNTVQP